MKTTIILIALSVYCCFPPHSPAADTDKQLDYSTLHLMQWVADCATKLDQLLRNQGVHPMLAQNQAGLQCACVIDGFRKNYTRSEVESMTLEDRGLFAEHFAKQCLGIIDDRRESTSFRAAN